MERFTDTYVSRFRATLLGAAIADALSFPLKDYSRTFLQSLARPVTAEYERHAGGYHAPGLYTDDTQTSLAVTRSILEAGKVDQQTVADYLIPLWRDLTVIDPDPSSSEAMQRLVKGVTAWHNSGLDRGRAEGGAISRALPVGLWSSWQPKHVPQDVDAVISVTHTDPRVVGSAAGSAAAVAYNVATDELVLGELLDRVAEAAGHFCQPLAEAVHDFPRILSQTDPKALRLILEVLPDDAYPPREDGLGCYSVPMFLVALYHFLKSPLDLETALSRVIRLGGDMGTASVLTAAFCASRLGMGCLPTRLFETLVNRAEIEEQIDELLEAQMRASPPRELVGNGKEGER